MRRRPRPRPDRDVTDTIETGGNLVVPDAPVQLPPYLYLPCAEAVADLLSLSSRLAKCGGAIGLIAGIGIDCYAGESPMQAIVSNGAGVLTGATVGAIAGSAVPIVGTVAGAAIGGITAFGRGVGRAFG